MNFRPIKTRVLHPPKDDLFLAIRKALPRLRERSIVVLSSKAVAIGEGRCISRKRFPDRDALAKREADLYLPRKFVPGRWSMLTITKGVFVASAGIDKSNANGFYVLWPKNPQDSARRLHAWFRKIYRLRDVGVIITDSHAVPLHRGLVGVAIGYHGFAPLKDYRKTKDIFGRKFKASQANIPDALAATAVLAMGEGRERTPIVVIEGADVVTFGGRGGQQRRFSSFVVPRHEDVYAPLIGGVKWRRGKSGT